MFQVPVQLDISFVIIPSKGNLETNPTPVKLLPVLFPPSLKRSEGENGHSFSSSSNIQNAYIYTTCP